MGMLDLFKKKTLTLNEEEADQWAQELADFQGVIKTQNKFYKQIDKKKSQVITAANKIVHSPKHVSVPERAAHLMEEHAKVLRECCEELIEELEFGANPLSFREELLDAVQKIADHKQKTLKNTSALKEFFSEELATLNNSQQELEDAIISTISDLEALRYEDILRVKHLQGEISSAQKRENKYAKTKEKYIDQLTKISEKKQKHQEKIANQKELVRHQQALSSLNKIKELEEQEHQICRFYEKLVFDIKRILVKSELTLSQSSKKLIDALQKDTKNTLRAEYEELKKELKTLRETLEMVSETPESLTTALEQGIKRLSSDAHMLENNSSLLHELKKDMMKDIAVLNVYEQEQFLLRARTEESQIKDKLAFIDNELSTNSYDLIRKLDELLDSFGAIRPDRNTQKNTQKNVSENKNNSPGDDDES